MQLRKEEKARLEGFYRRKDYTAARYGNVGMQTYSNIRATKINKVIESRFGNESRVSVIDIGCGTGVLLKQLLHLNGKYNLNGLDFSSQMLENTVLNQKELAEVNLVQGSAFETPFDDNTFDALTCTRFIHQYDDNLKIELLKEMNRIVKNDGIIIVEFYSYSYGLIKKVLRNLLDPEYKKSKIDNSDFYKHYVTKARLDKLFTETDYTTEPLVLPFHSFLTKTLGVINFLRLNKIIELTGPNFLFSEFLVIFNKIDRQFG